MRFNPNEPKHCIDVDSNMVKEFSESELGRLLNKRITPLPTAKILMVSNPTKVRDAYFDMKVNHR